MLPGYSMEAKGVTTTSRILSLLVLKPCELIELTCHVSSRATQAVVNYLEGTYEQAGKPVQKAVTAELLAKSIHASRLVQRLSDELNSITWWPCRGVELYNVCSLSPEPAAFANFKPLHILTVLMFVDRLSRNMHQGPSGAGSHRQF